MTIHDDLLEILTSSRWPLEVDDIRHNLESTWPRRRGEKPRVVTETQALEALLDLFSRGNVDKVDGSWRLKREVAEPQEVQRILF